MRKTLIAIEQSFNFEVTADDKGITLNAFEKLVGENAEEKFMKDSLLVMRSKISFKTKLAKKQRIRAVLCDPILFSILSEKIRYLLRSYRIESEKKDIGKK